MMMLGIFAFALLLFIPNVNAEEIGTLGEYDTIEEAEDVVEAETEIKEETAPETTEEATEEVEETVEEPVEEHTGFWAAIVNFFKAIADFFRNLFS